MTYQKRKEKNNTYMLARSDHPVSIQVNLPAVYNLIYQSLATKLTFENCYIYFITSPLSLALI